MSTATQTRRAQLLSAEQLREQQEISGREGLSSLLAAVRRMMNWLLSPFRLVARVLFKPKEVAGVSSATDKTGQADRAAAPATASIDDVSFDSLAPGDAARNGNDPELGVLMKQISENPGGGLDVEVTGKAEDLDAVLPMLLRHIDQILKTHLPSDAQEGHVAAHLVALAETAECSRYAHRMVSREVDSAMKAVVADPKYLGLSAGTIENMLRAAAQSPEATAAYGDGSAEQRLLARLAVRDKIEADFSLQMRQMAVALAPVIGMAKSAAEMEGRGKELLTSVMQAADAARNKLRVRHAAHGSRKVLPETLPEVGDALGEAIGHVVSAMNEKRAAEAAAPEASELAGDATESVAARAAPAAQVDGEAAPAATAEVPAAPEAVSLAKEAEVMVAAPAPATSTTTVKAATVAVKSVVAAGMFGGTAVVSRTAAEMDDVNVVDPAFDVEEGETLVGG
jgi:Sec-independent protein translocase protein TatA